MTKKQLALTREEKESLRLAYEFMFDEYKKRFRARTPAGRLGIEWLIKRMKQMQSALLKISYPEKIEFAELKGKE